MENKGHTPYQETKRHLGEEYSPPYLNLFNEKAKSLQTAKYFTNTSNFITKKATKQIYESLSKDAKETYKFIQDGNQLAQKAEDLSELTKFILSRQEFIGFESAQLLIMPRGSQNCSSIIYSRVTGGMKSSIQANAFNEVFNTVKKSKNKIFDQSQNELPGIQVLGTFLAREFELDEHNAVIIISRDSFLPNTPNEHNHFNNLMNHLHVVLNNIIKNYFNSEQGSMIFSIIENAPLKIDFINGELKIAESDIDNIHSDIFHHQKIALLGDLLNTLGHELSNPLFGLKLITELLLPEAIDEDDIETLRDIINNTDRCQTIIKNFAFLYKDSNENELVSIDALMKETITLTKSATRSVNIKLNIEETNFETYLNQTWFTQILFNMIINSTQALEENKVEGPQIVINCVHNEDNILISVADNGPGLPTQNIKNIFEPFYTTKSKGTGLGLSICKNLTEKMGGTIGAKNTSPQGAEFWFKIPIRGKDDR